MTPWFKENFDCVNQAETIARLFDESKGTKSRKSAEPQQPSYNIR
jgi:hypothetical protein